MRSSPARAAYSPSPLSLGRGTDRGVPPDAFRWRRMVGRRRGADVASLLIYAHLTVVVAVMLDAAGARLLPTRGEL